ncbi:hypothetical protein WISP_57788 [Willisornis vidua]|uniref:Protein kinase domain-containing protein n=1 Tax=Willisornis vidua TaxID=1566151 RepID=A0ABQ9DH64_9PASS|nr:hypothetical protein WISP_57788 [Willisornis vidua]
MVLEKSQQSSEVPTVWKRRSNAPCSPMALRSAHSLGHIYDILQCGIKLENIILDLATGGVKPIDFGCVTCSEEMLYTQMTSS